MKKHDDPRSPLVDATIITSAQDEWGYFDIDIPTKIDPDASLACRNCGYALVEYSEAKKAVQKEYSYSDEELDSGANTIKVWCPQCAVADGRVDDIGEVEGEFYWEVR